MGLILPPPALRALIRLKGRALVRSQTRRFKRPSGILFGILGIALFGLWFFSLTIGRHFGRDPERGREMIERVLHPEGVPGEGAEEPQSPVDLRRPLVQIVCLVLTIMTVLGALGHRGLYLPKEEIERLLAAPVARSDLVRYRLIVNLTRSLFAGLIFGLLSLGRLPNPVFGFVGVFVAMLTLPLMGQIASLLAGDAENRVGRLFKGGRLRIFNVALAIVLWLIVMGLIFGERFLRKLPFDFDDLTSAGRDVLTHPAARAVLLPFEPWARLVTAERISDFLPWLAVCAVLWVVLFELAARVPIDFRELSLETSADVARRLRRLGTRGFGASSGKVSKRALRRRIPWIFGRGPFGAVAWLKLGAILRKARGTVLVSLGIVGLLTIVFTALMPDDDPREILGGAAVIAVIGTFYLCAGLRFDFRMDLDQMSSIKAFPMRPRSVFLATVLPEVVLVSALLIAAVLARSVLTGRFHPALVAIAGFQPLFAFLWVAVDNAVFLFAPIRYVPGQEGALHHAGRSAALWLLRMVLLGTLVGVAGGLGALGGGGVVALGGGETLAFTVAGLLGWCVLAAACYGVVLLGGVMLSRFDLARDRG